MVMSRPTDWARAIGVVAKVTSMGAVATGFAIGMSTLHYAAPSLDAASISHDRFATDLCTDNPADPTCPPQGPTDVKCATAAWQATAVCAGGPFAPNIVTPPTPFPRLLVGGRRLPRLCASYPAAPGRTIKSADKGSRAPAARTPSARAASALSAGAACDDEVSAPLRTDRRTVIRSSSNTPGSNMPW
jgi:hypothetical protein